MDLVFALSEFLRLVGALNESVRLITVQYMFKNSFRIKTTLLESLQSQIDLGKTCWLHLDLARSKFLRFVAAPYESLRLIIIYYTFKSKFGIKTSLLVWLQIQKSPLKARFRHNWLKGLSFCAKWIFKACWSCEWVPKAYYNTIYVQILI